jgi:hypothetical protein
MQSVSEESRFLTRRERLTKALCMIDTGRICAKKKVTRIGFESMIGLCNREQWINHTRDYGHCYQLHHLPAGQDKDHLAETHTCI